MEDQAVTVDETKAEEKVIECSVKEEAKESIEDVKDGVVVAADTAQEEKTTEDTHKEKAEAAEEKPEGVPSSEPLTETTSFKEESYSVGDLTEAEKKALEAFRSKVEEAIKKKTIFKTSKKAVVVEEKGVPESTAETAIPAAVETETTASASGEVEETQEGPPPAAEETTVPEADLVEPANTKSEDPAAPISEKREIVFEDTAEVVEMPPPVEGPKNFYVWGIPIHEGDEKTDLLLLKFLRARNFKVDDTLAMLKSTVNWRKEFAADALAEQEEEVVEGAEEFQKWAFLHGTDKEGHPVCYNRNVFQSSDLCEKAKFGEFLKWRVQMMEKSIRSHLDFSPGGVQSFVQVIDLQNSPGLLKGAQAMKKFVSLLQDNYPELASRQIVLNMPWWYYPALYRVFKAESKVVWAGPGKSTETLFKYISPDQVPIQYGGLGRPNDSEFQGVEAPVTQLIVKAGEKRLIELPIEEAGTTLVWDVSVVGWDVVYGEEFVPNTYTVIIQKPKRLGSSSEPLRNTFKATEAGKVVLAIDNSASKKKKLLVYRFTAKRT